MSHTISARKPEGFKVEVADWNGNIVHSAWHQDRNEAVEAAQHYERIVTLAGGSPIPTLDEIMTDDELFAELLA